MLHLLRCERCRQVQLAHVGAAGTAGARPKAAAEAVVPPAVQQHRLRHDLLLQRRLQSGQADPA